MKKTRFKERELDLVVLFWKLLEQWKAIFIVGLAMALLLSSAAIIKNRSDAKKEVEIDPSVVNVLSLYADFIEKKQQYDNDFFNNIDLNNCVTVTCLYEYNTVIINEVNNAVDEATLGLLNNLYNMMLSDDTFRKDLITTLKEYWPDIDSTSLEELVKCTAAHTIAYGPGTVIINIVIPKDGDPEKLQQALTDCVYAYYNRVSGSASKKNTMKFVNCAYKETDFTAEMNARNSRYSPISTSNSQYKAAYKELEDDAQSQVDEARNKCGNSGDPSVYVEYLEKASKRTVSTRSLLIRYGLIGFIAGIAFYSFAYIICIILLQRIRSEGDLENAAGVRNFGGIYEYPYTGKLMNFLHDRKIYTRRAKALCKDIDRICKDIMSKLEFSGKKAYTLITVGKPSDRAQAINSEQLQIMNDNSISVDVLGIDNGVDSVEDSVFAGLNNSVLIELLGQKTTWRDVSSLYSKLLEYNIDIIGSEYIEA